jgi:hypothetical protein
MRRPANKPWLDRRSPDVAVTLQFLVGPVVGTWYAIGLVYLVVLVRTRPERLRETGRVFVDEPAGQAPAPR